MAIKKSKTVALERRGDLTSLLLMIKIYGPAVALAIFAMLSLWAVFIIYKSVRGRRKDENMLVTEKDAVNPPGKTPKEVETVSGVESTEERNDELSEMLESKSVGESTADISETINTDTLVEDYNVDYLAIEGYHPCSSPENQSEPQEQCPRHDQAGHEPGQVEPATDCSPSGMINETEHLKDTVEMKCQSEHRKEAGKQNVACHCESTGKVDGEINHPHTSNEGELREGPENTDDETLPEVVMDDADLDGPQRDQVCDEQEVGEIHTQEVTNENAWETEAIVKEFSPYFPQASRDVKLPTCVEQVEDDEGLDAYLTDKQECVDDPITSQQDEVWPEAPIGPQEPLRYQPQLKTEPYENLEDDPIQSDLHPDVIDQLNKLMEYSDGHLISQFSESVVSSCESNGLHDRMGGQVFTMRKTSFTDQLSELTEARDSSAIDLLSEQITVTSMIDQLMEPTKLRNPLIFDKKESLDRSLETEMEDGFEKTEINIMEATMDNNEWMTVGTTEGNTGEIPWLTSTNSSLTAHAESTHLQGEDQQDTTNDTAMDPHDPKEDLGTVSSNVTAMDAHVPKEDPETSSVPLDGDHGNKKVAAVQPLPQTVRVSFRVHYLTSSPCQVLAVTGNQQELGSWKSFVPLERAKGGFWASSISLPADSQVEWKFVLVEGGGIQRWEECSNRHLEMGHGEDVHLHKWWGSL